MQHTADIRDYEVWAFVTVAMAERGENTGSGKPVSRETLADIARESATATTRARAIALLARSTP